MDTFSALADPTRRRIVELLASRGQLSASEISQTFSSSPPAISQHLKVLHQAKLVRMEKRAQQRLYTLDVTGLTALEEWLAQMRALWTQRLEALDEYLKAERSQPPQETSYD